MFSTAHGQGAVSVWGDIPTWVGALATFLALVAAVVAVRVSWNVLMLERAREDRQDAFRAEQREADERAFQADQIAAWAEQFDPTEDRSIRLDSPYGALVLNNSALPAYDVTVEIHGPEGSPRAHVGPALIPPGTHKVQYPDAAPISVEEERGFASKFRVALQFRDTAGRVWRRDTNGTLTKVE